MSGAAGSSQWMYVTGYEVDQSLRFNDGDSAYLTFTAGTPTSAKIGTFSVWVKPCGLTGADQSLFGSYTNANNRAYIRLHTDGNINMYDPHSSSGSINIKTTATFRDPSAWMHILIAIDVTQGTSSNRLKIYVNGEQVTDFSAETYPDNVDQTLFKDGNTYAIGASQDSAFGRYLDGYLAEYNFIDGQQLTPASFGETGTYGEWKPRKYSGTYGNNGFYLPFEQDYTVEGFSAVTYKGAGAVRYVGGTGFQPDLVWIKSRDHSYGHHLTDAVRGAGKDLYTDTVDDEVSNANTLQSFESDGFTLGTDNGPNNSSKRYVAWTWDMGGSNANNTTGSIDSVVRANATYGQSIVSYTGTGSTATIGHGLSSAPEWIIIKRRDASTNWPVWHTSISDGTDDFVELNSNADKVTNEATFFTSTDPTSSVFSVGSSTQTNANNATHIAYCWHSVTGYSSFGSYTGNGNATGPTITTGFRPAFVMIKVVDRTDGGNGGWFMYDNTRSPNTGDTSAANHVLQANSDAVEIVADANLALDFLSNGFQLKASYDEINVNNGAYIYMAFADKREYAYYLDQSGNNNDWATNNLTESDISVDSPTNNFATFNPLTKRPAANGLLSEGNLKYTSHTGDSNVFATMGILPSQKVYFEVYLQANSNQNFIGISNLIDNGDGAFAKGGSETGSYGRKVRGAGTVQQYFNNGSGTDLGVNNVAVGVIVGVAVDNENGKVHYAFNNTWDSDATDNNPAADVTGFNTSVTQFPQFSTDTPNNTVINIVNFGQDSSFAGNKTAQGNQDGNDIGDFYYTPPTGYLALCTKNLPEPAVVPSKNFNTVLYEGNGSTQDITVGFQPDLTWIKNRDANDSHALVDSIRGVTEELTPDLDSAEVANDDGLTAFITTGFSLGDDVKYNTNNESYVSWNWKAGATELGTGDFTQGSIASTCRRNVEAGFSIVEFTGTQENATVGHGLSKAPDFIFMHHRNSTGGWATFNSGLGATVNLDISTTGGTNDEAEIWQDTVPSATLVTVGNTTYNNKDDEIYVMYCFHDVDGFSKFGVYTGNGAADNAFVYTGFRPAFVYIKSTANSTPWMMWDTERDPDNPVINYLLSEANNTEANAVSDNSIDILSNGFKIRTAAADMGQAAVHAYVAFAETPLKYSNGR